MAMNTNESFPPERTLLSESDERAIDALLSEICNGVPGPPDLSMQIVRTLVQLKSLPSSKDVWESLPNAEEVRVGRIVMPAPPVAALGVRKGWSGVTIAASLLALAASLAVVIANVPQTRLWLNPSIAANEELTDNQTDAAPSITDKNAMVAKSNVKDSSPVATKAKPANQGVPLVRSESKPEHQISGEPMALDSATDADPVASNVHSVDVGSLNQSLVRYWTQLGVEPAGRLGVNALAEKVEQRFGSRPLVDEETVSFGSTLNDEVASRPFAARLFDELFRGIALADGARDLMINEAAQTIARGKGFDVLVAKWISDESLFAPAAPDRFGESVATNLLDADVACARCHDSPVDGRIAQHDYWSFASLFSPPGRPALFYELGDGRQKVAERRLPSPWFAPADKETVRRASEKFSSHASARSLFADSLIGSRTLAGAIANRVWKVGLGEEMTPPASDPFVAPRNDELLNSHEQLTKLLVTNRFDVRAIARLVMASEAMARGETELSKNGQWHLADNARLKTHAAAVRAFAAQRPALPRWRQQDLVAFVSSRIGNGPRQLGDSDSVLAQPLIEGDSSSSKAANSKSPEAEAEEQLWATWIADQDLLRDSWLHWIKDDKQRHDHVYYAMNQSPRTDDAGLLVELQSLTEESPPAIYAATDRLLWVLRNAR